MAEKVGKVAQASRGKGGGKGGGKGVTKGVIKAGKDQTIFVVWPRNNTLTKQYTLAPAQTQILKLLLTCHQCVLSPSIYSI